MSHRGFWRSPGEKNAIAAFDHTLDQGFGTETDVRDVDGALVVSHDPASPGALPWFEVVERFDRSGLPLAVNVKADGLSGLLQAAFEGRDIDWFAFDMSGPETLRFARAGLPFFTRHSNIEPEPILYEQAQGVWLDDFDGGWSLTGPIGRHLDAGKKVCVVSSELHGRDHRTLWAELKAFGVTDDRLMLCSDVPHLAREFFGS